MNAGQSARTWRGIMAVCLSVPLMVCAGPVRAQEAGQAESAPGVTVCLTVASLRDVRAIVVVPSGTVFGAKGPPHRGKARAGLAAQALVTTETVTLTATQPCAGADAAGVVSVTRGWTAPVVPGGGPSRLFLPSGRISGNGLDTDWLEDDETLRALVQAGGLSATVHGHLPEVVHLLESAADRDEQEADAASAASHPAAEQTDRPLRGQTGGQTKGQVGGQARDGTQADPRAGGGAVARHGADPFLDALPDLSAGAGAADDLPSQRGAH